MLIAEIAHNPHAGDLPYRFVVEKWDELLQRYGTQPKSLARILEAVFAGGKTADHLHRAAEVFDTHHLGSAKRASKQILGTIESNISWLHRYEKTVVDWFKSRQN